MPLPFLERGSWKTIWEFLRVGTVTPRGLWGLAQVLFNLHLLAFGLKNLLYELPYVGTYVFAALAARKVIPTMRASMLRVAKGAGGIRGQLIDLNTGKLLKAQRILAPDGMPANCIPSPSPGASKCLGNAVDSVRNHVRWLGPNYWFDESRMRRELRRVRPVPASVS